MCPLLLDVVGIRHRGGQEREILNAVAMWPKRDKQDIKTRGFAWNLGRLALWLRDHYLLLIVQLIAAIVVAVLVFTTPPDGTQLTLVRWVVLVSAILAAGASAADKFADHHAEKIEVLSEVADQAAGTRAVARLMALLENVNDVIHSTPADARRKMPMARLAAAELASSMPSADGVRASVYTLARDDNGKFQMVDPVTRGRPEDAVTEFRVDDQPGHSIWRLLTAPDKNCEIFNEGDMGPDFDWRTKTYKTFVTLPVRMGKAVFGMLTANALKPGDLTELDRVSFITAARILALAEAAVAADFKTRDDIKELRSLGAGSISGTGNQGT